MYIPIIILSLLLFRRYMYIPIIIFIIIITIQVYTERIGEFIPDTDTVQCSFFNLCITYTINQARNRSRGQTR